WQTHPPLIDEIRASLFRVYKYRCFTEEPNSPCRSAAELAKASYAMQLRHPPLLEFT
ncbi:unnamed protein product, partial [Musa acuminata var. zebrina]